MDEIDYYEYEEVIKEFWRCNIKQDYSTFDFKQAFENIGSEIQIKLTEHGLTSMDEFKEYMKDIYDFSSLDAFETQTNYIQICASELEDVVLEFIYKKYKDTFTEYPSFHELLNLYEDIQNYSDSDKLYDKVVLFDKCIHAEHETALVLDIRDIDVLRKEFDEELLKKEV